MDVTFAKWCWALFLLCGFAIGSAAQAADDAGVVAAQIVKEFKELRAAGKTDEADKKLRDAVETYEDRLHQQPNDAQAHFALAQLVVHLDQVATAEVHLEQAIQLEPNNAAMYAFKGKSHGVAKEFPAAIKALRRALELDPKNAEARILLAMCLANQNETAEALSQTREALKSLPKNHEATTLLAVMLLGASQHEEWERTVRELVAERPQDEKCRELLITGFLVQQKFDAAYRECLELQKLKPNDAGLEERLVVLATQAKEPALAATHIERLREYRRAGKFTAGVFLRDRFFQGPKQLAVEEKFELAPDAGTKFDFHVLNDKEQVDYTLSLMYSEGFNAYLIREGKIKENEKAFVLAKLKNGQPEIFATFTTLPTYEEVRSMVVEVLEGTRPGVITANQKRQAPNR
ncbi:tetratricopeptide repeat protein [Anatilimnocola floriformis]|uniref:tetratricopeptide repeat protein n=1 Tax=Anatilimnocola floriformis TaxID=2948575 RepID=UPI0020C2F9F5|nr:tetratricopeptide repeat protein [Anatilimnocola floriformis]